VGEEKEEEEEEEVGVGVKGYAIEVKQCADNCMHLL